MERCAIGLVGWGTVGQGVVEILSQDHNLFRERCGLDLTLKRIVTRTPGRIRNPAAPPGTQVGSDLSAILEDDEIATVVHLVGGLEEARRICAACLEAGKHVITANKAMLAVHGDALFALAARKQVAIAFEAAVAGGIPLIAALRDGLVANRIEAISGILNGTCNYVLSRMEAAGSTYQAALGEAQSLGYAEIDPALDVDGTDTAHKLAILTRIAFGGRVDLSSIRVEGIAGITFADIASAKVMGARIKLLAVARRQEQGLELHVAPTLIPLDHPLAAVNGNHNGIFIESHAAGTTLLVGQGAGARPTASAVLADVVDVCTGRYLATAKRFSFFTSTHPLAILPEGHELTASYARFHVSDRTGVLAGVASILSRHGVSVLSLHQGEPAQGGQAVIEAITHPLQAGPFLAAIEEIDRSGLTITPTVVLRRL